MRIPVYNINLIMALMSTEVRLDRKYEPYYDSNGINGIAGYVGIAPIDPQSYNADEESFILKISRGPKKFDYVVHYDPDFFPEDFIDNIPLNIVSILDDRRSLEFKTTEEVKQLRKDLERRLASY